MSAHHVFRFHALGFQRNPFGSLTAGDWVAVAVLSPDIRALLAAPPDHLQLIGPKGCGKTTHLFALVGHFRAAGEQIAYQHLPLGQHRFTVRLAGLDRLLLDEAQRLSALSRWWLLRSARRSLRTVLTTHTDLTPHYVRHGLAVTTLQVDALTTPDHLRAVLARRLAYFALDSVPRVALAPEALDWLWSRFGADLRAVESHLYEVFQQLDAPRTITTTDLVAVRRAPTPDRPPTAG